MPRDLRLIRLENLDAIADAEFLVTEQVNESQPRAVSQGFEKCFQVATHSVTDYDLDGSCVRLRKIFLTVRASQSTLYCEVN
jgi:hypothetical protein